MDLAAPFCPTPDCPARGQSGQGNIGIHSRQERRFVGKQCHKTFTPTTGTAFYRVRPPAEPVRWVLTLRAPGCPLQASVGAFGFDERTVAAWFARAGHQAQAVPAHGVEQPRDLGQVPADEIRVKQQGKRSWRALAMSVGTRRWVAGEGSEQRDLGSLRRRWGRVRRCAARRPLRVCSEGFRASPRASSEALREPQSTGQRGRPRWPRWKTRPIAQVVKP
jgi:transposase-like protein